MRCTSIYLQTSCTLKGTIRKFLSPPWLANYEKCRRGRRMVCRRQHKVLSRAVGRLWAVGCGQRLMLRSESRRVLTFLIAFDEKWKSRQRRSRRSRRSRRLRRSEPRTSHTIHRRIPTTFGAYAGGQQASGALSGPTST